jgi:hypothetical protein
MSKGGMQSKACHGMYCKCGKMTSKTIFFDEKEISIHFGKNRAYWHITENGKTKRVMKKPNEWF